MTAKRTGFLAKIAALTSERIQHEKRSVSEAVLRERIAQNTYAPRDFCTALRKGHGIIAEIKRKSPSRGAIAPDLDPVAVAREYLASGASAISVLTEPTHFGGEVDDLNRVRAEFPNAALLMKDFVLESYQLLQARAYRADAVLLIVAFLDVASLQRLYSEAVALGLTPLIEVHDETELAQAQQLQAPLLGINNRDLRTLATDLEVSRRLVRSKDPHALFVSESGIESKAAIDELRALGFEGFLVGTALMQNKTPGASLRKLVGL
jgi:indole-3-glycerol phosphate synthase